VTISEQASGDAAIQTGASISRVVTVSTTSSFTGHFSISVAKTDVIASTLVVTIDGTVTAPSFSFTTVILYQSPDATIANGATFTYTVQFNEAGTYNVQLLVAGP